MADHYICAAWGALRHDFETHMDCPVTVSAEGQRVPRLPPLPSLPFVCQCECTTCKRAWEAAGRPKTGPVTT